VLGCRRCGVGPSGDGDDLVSFSRSFTAGHGINRRSCSPTARTAYRGSAARSVPVSPQSVPGFLRRHAGAGLAISSGSSIRVSGPLHARSALITCLQSGVVASMSSAPRFPPVHSAAVLGWIGGGLFAVVLPMSARIVLVRRGRLFPHDVLASAAASPIGSAIGQRVY